MRSFLRTKYKVVAGLPLIGVIIYSITIIMHCRGEVFSRIIYIGDGAATIMGPTTSSLMGVSNIWSLTYAGRVTPRIVIAWIPVASTDDGILILPLWPLLLALLIYGAATGWRQRKCKVNSNLCKHCSYNLLGIAGNVCPECGRRNSSTACRVWRHRRRGPNTLPSASRGANGQGHRIP
jgi:hypothetical protein